MASGICRLCSGRIASDELQQHLTGEYHKICMSTIVAAELGIDFLKYPQLCAWCSEVISAHSVIARSGELVVHLGCFFGHDRRRSLGAAAAMPTLKDRSRLLRQYSDVLQRKARSVQERAAATRVRHALHVVDVRPRALVPPRGLSRREILSWHEARLLEGADSIVRWRLTVRRARVLRIVAADVSERARRTRAAAAAAFDRALRTALANRH